MKVVIFAGGKGTRISEESYLRPKPMIEIGERPILWHIMKIYASYGHNEFIICCGYKGWMIKEYFLNYFMHNSDITVNLADNTCEVHHSPTGENFKVTLVDTGLETQTAGRLRRVLKYTGNEDFMLTYGDGVSDVNINALVEEHKKSGKICTMTCIQAGSRFGVVNVNEAGQVTGFVEKPVDEGTWINGGFFVIKPEVANYLHEDADSVMWERQPLDDLAKDGQMNAYRHRGFWKCMDTLRDKEDLEKLWQTHPLWKTW
ncbi:MAG: glucose-1-phosphate cytidylyltransferase [Flavobacteriales bacterium]|nr:glucose-1-phosphate cytidylyltransferase [Flavobacteriales bacterium]